MNQITLGLTGKGKLNNRRELDFYPTPKDVTIALMEFLNLEKTNIWEPACGNGAMVKVLESYGHNVTGTDITEGYDYLKINGTGLANVIITNPPFSLSDQFIEKALKEADIVCMLLKSQYWHAKKRRRLFINNLPSYILPLTWRPDFFRT